MTQHGSSFRAPATPPRSQDSIGYEARDPGLGRMPDSLFGLVDDQMVETVLTFIRATAIGVGALYSSLPTDGARQVLTCAVNDVVALVERVDQFDGRGAAHVARAGLEHLVNFLDLSDGNDALSNRYTRHRHVTTAYVASHRWHLKFLPPKRRRKEQARLDKLDRKARAELAAALMEYGKGYKNGWHKGNLFDRAEAHGVEDRYIGYRILSSVIHGASGAMLGITRQIAGSDIHRIGRDLSLAAFAYGEGLWNFERITQALEDATGRQEATSMREATVAMLERLDDVRSALSKVDTQLWPSEPMMLPIAVAAVYQGPTIRWFEFNQASQTLTKADLIEEAPRTIAKVRELYAEHDPTSQGGRPMTVFFGGIRVKPVAGAQPFPAASIMVPPAEI